MRKSYRPHFEQLEDRCVPSVTSTMIGGSLYIKGTPAGDLDINRTTAHLFTVTDTGGGTSGPFNVTSNLSITLQSEPGNINIDMNGGNLPGSVTIDLGVGYIGTATGAVDIYDDSGAATPGKISGSVTIVHGNGQEDINIGAPMDPPADPSMTPVTIGGSLSVSMAKSNFGGQGDLLRVLDGVTVLGSISTVQVDQVTLGGTASGDPLTKISGSVTINDAGSLNPLLVTVLANIGGSVNVTGTALDDSFALQQTASPTTPLFGQVKGSLNVNLGLGQNGDNFLLGANTRVYGSATLTGSDNVVDPPSAGEQFTILGEVDQNLNVQMGNGTNSLAFGNTTPFSNLGDPQAIVYGNMTVTGGSGTNNIGVMATGEFTGTVMHNLTITLGAGDNGTAGDPMIFAGLVGGTFKWSSGNGQDVVQLGDFTTSGNNRNYLVNMLFGNDDDSLTVDLGAGFLSGKANGGDRVTMNTFTLESGTLLPSFVLSNWNP